VPLIQQPWFMTLQSVPALAFIGAVVYRKTQMIHWQIIRVYDDNEKSAANHS